MAGIPDATVYIGDYYNPITQFNFINSCVSENVMVLSLSSLDCGYCIALYAGNLDERVDERILYEIMVQAGPLVNVNIPRDNDSKKHKGYGFAEYTTESNAQYAVRLFSGLVCLHNRPLRFQVGDYGPRHFCIPFLIMCKYGLGHLCIHFIRICKYGLGHLCFPFLSISVKPSFVFYIYTINSEIHLNPNLLCVLPIYPS
jgi:hypothetical protein